MQILESIAIDTGMEANLAPKHANKILAPKSIFHSNLIYII